MKRTSKARNSCLWILCVVFLSACVTSKPARKKHPTSLPAGTSRNHNKVDQEREHPGRSQLWLGDQEVWLEVAADSQSRGLGLGRRSSLAKDDGMIFVYGQSDFRSFWMKNTWVSLDIAFVSDDLLITQIESLDPPAVNCSDADMPRAKSKSEARYVVEMGKGWFKKAGIGVGDFLRFSSSLQSEIKGAHLR